MLTEKEQTHAITSGIPHDMDPALSTFGPPWLKNARRHMNSYRPQESICPYCQDWIVLPTREHIRPKAHGGGDGHNREWACSECNNRRGRQPLLIYLRDLWRPLEKYDKLLDADVFM